MMTDDREKTKLKGFDVCDTFWWIRGHRVLPNLQYRYAHAGPSLSNQDPNSITQAQ